MSRSLSYILQISLLLILTFIIATPVVAQIQGVKVGDRVRISAPSLSSGRLVGTVVDNSPSATVINQNDSTLIIPNASIQRLSVRTRKTSRLVIVGVSAVSSGLSFGAVFSRICWSDCNRVFFKAFPIGVGLGALMGLIFPINRWEEVPISVSMGLTPTRNSTFSANPSVSLRLRF